MEGMNTTKKFEELAIAASQSLKERDYWLNKLWGKLERVGFPYDHQLTDKGSGERDTVMFAVTGERFSRLMRLCSGSDPRLHMILASAVISLLYKYTGTRDIIVGTTITRQPVEGEFVNTLLALRNQVNDNMTFKEFLLQFRQTIVEAYEHQNYPVETLLYELGLSFSRDNFPLFDTVVLLENIHDKKYLYPVQPGIIFSFLRVEGQETVQGVVEFSGAVYQRTTIEKLADRFIRVLEQVLWKPDIPIPGIDIISQEERKKLLTDFNDTRGDYPREKTLHDMFRESAGRDPDHIALIFADRQITYRLLNEKANRLARVLRREGAAADTALVIMADISIEMVIGTIAILKSGAAFLPVDPDYPPDRAACIVSDSRAPMVLTQKVTGDKIAGHIDARVVHLDDDASYGKVGADPGKACHADNLAYIIYTSGSTGKPKGVMISHNSIVNQLYGLEKRYAFDGSLHHILLAPFTFDPAVQQVFLPLDTGGKLFLAAKCIKSDPQKLSRLLTACSLDVVNTVPTLMAALVNCTENDRPPYFRYIILAGEVFPVELAAKLKKTVRAGKIINIYGPAEAAINTTLYQCEEKTGSADGASTVPIGRPLMNYRVYILDNHSQLTPPGLVGELCIAGEGLARGYLNQPELTAEKFDHKGFFNKKLLQGVQGGGFLEKSPPGRRRHYRTGDLARWLPDGNIEFMGRLDHQVKIRGMRVELEEIDNRLLQHEAVKEAVVIAREDKNKNKSLCACIVGRGSAGELNIHELRSYLQDYLPDYMVPGHYIVLEEIPLTSSGKIDRPALQELAAAHTGSMGIDGDYTPPRDDTEKKLVQIWEKELELERVGTRDNYFNIGGDSIKSIELLNMINREFGVDLEAADLFTYNTVETLARKIKDFKRDTGNDEYKTVIEEIAALKKTVMSKREIRENIEDVYPMCDIQKGMVYYYIKNPDTWQYHFHVVFQVKFREFDPGLFKKAVTLMAEKHPILRTTLNMNDYDEPVQLVHKELPPDVLHLDITHMNTEEAEAYLGDFMADDRQKAYDVSTMEPLWRIRTFAVRGENIVLLWSSHHAIIDGWSHASLMTEINNTYLELKKDPGVSPGKLKSTFKEAVIEEMVEKRNTRNREFWLNELAAYNRLKFPVMTRNRVKGNSAGEYRGNLGLPLMKKLQAAAKTYDSTLKNLCFAAYVYVMSMFSYEYDMVVGLLTSNRPLCADGDKVLGCFLNTLPVRIRIPVHIRWKDYIRLIDRKMVELKKYERISLFEIVHIIGERGQEENPLFDTMFYFTDFHVYRGLEQEGDFCQGFQPAQESELSLEGYGETNMLLNFNISTTLGFFTLRIDYKDTVFSVEAIKKLHGYFECVLNRMISRPESLAGKDNIISPGEKQTLLYKFNDTMMDWPEEKTIHLLFEEQVGKSPDSMAASDMGPGGNHVTYRELNERANRLAHLLRQKGVQPDSETVVGLMMESSVEMVVAMLAIMKAGGAYLPIDPKYPPERIMYMLEDSGALFLVTRESIIERPALDSLKRPVKYTGKAAPVITAPRKQISDFDSLPAPDRSLVDYKKYHKYIGSAMAKHTVSIQASRGCPFKCIYCNKICTGKYVVRSAENIFKEITRCYRAGIRRFTFIDDVFNLDEKNASVLLEKLIKNRMDVQLFFANGLRGDILSKEFIDLMVEAGTVSICVALESGSQRIQKLIKKNLNLEKFKDNVLYITQKYPHIILEMELMHGFPTETEEEAMMTLDFLLDIKWVHFPDLHILKIYPHTSMYKLAVEHGISEEKIARSVTLAYHEIPETLPFSKNFTREYQVKFLNEYFFLKERLLKVLPYQMKVLSEDELVQKYDSYLPVEIKSFSDILECARVSPEELGDVEILQNDSMGAADFSEKMAKYSRGEEKAADAFRVLLLDLSLSFTWETDNMLYDVVEAPLGLMYLMTYLNEKLGRHVCGSVYKSRIDFDSCEELKDIVINFKPDLLGIRTLSIYKDFFHRSVSLIRQWGVDVPIVGGGPYATTEYMEMLRDDNVDLAVLGEGELTLTELIEKMTANGKKLPGEEILQEIAGIAYIKKKDKTLLKQANREIILPDKITDRLARQPGENLKSTAKPGNLVYVIYTSGSTGKPKGVMLEHRNLVNLIRFQQACTNIDSSKILQFSTISFDASFHEIFSALLTGGQIYLVDKETRANVPELFNVVARNEIKTVFLPISFLKLIFEEDDYIRRFPGCIKHIQTAGEQVVISDSFKTYLREADVYLHNHYGPSETHVVTTFTIDPGGDIQELPPIGKPVMNTGIYILDKGQQLVPAGVPGDLFIGGVQVGRGYLGNVQLTSVKFISSPFAPNRRLYQTGDLAKWLPHGDIEFLGRIDHQVKIRGFRVELGEIESRLLNHPEVKDAVLLSRTDETGDKYLCAYLVSNRELDISELRQYLSKHLPDYMIPSYFVFLGNIPLTPNGKIDRKALPEPVIKAGEKYIAPRDRREENLAVLWSEVLGIEKGKIGIDCSFFELGGHSLKATVLVSKIHKEFNVKIPLAELFQLLDIRSLAEYIKKAAADKYTFIKPVERKSYYPLSSVQKRLYFLQQLDPGNKSYNLPEAAVLEGVIHVNRLENTFRQLIRRHESFRTSFRLVSAEPVQEIHDHADFEIEYYDSNGSPGEIIGDFIRPFDLSGAPLMRAGLIKSGEKKHVLMVDMHHITADGTSHAILVNEFMALCAGEQLPGLPLQYRDYSEWQNSKEQKEAVMKQEAFWLEQFRGEIPVLKLPGDYARPRAKSFEGGTFTFELSMKETQELKARVLEAEVTLYIMLLAIFNVFLAKMSGQEDIVVGTSVAGRGHADLERIIGMFVNALALRNFPRPARTFGDFLREVKERTISAFENRDYQFENLVEKMDVKVHQDTGRNPLFDVMFVLNNEERPQLEIPGLKLRPCPFESGAAQLDLKLRAAEGEEEIFFSIEYSTKLFSEETIEMYAGNFKEVLFSVIRNINVKLEDIGVSHDLGTAEFKMSEARLTF